MIFIEQSISPHKPKKKKQNTIPSWQCNSLAIQYVLSLFFIFFFVFYYEYSNRHRPIGLRMNGIFYIINSILCVYFNDLSRRRGFLSSFFHLICEKEILGIPADIPNEKKMKMTTRRWLKEKLFKMHTQSSINRNQMIHAYHTVVWKLNRIIANAYTPS